MQLVVVCCKIEETELRILRLKVNLQREIWKCVLFALPDHSTNQGQSLHVFTQ